MYIQQVPLFVIGTTMYICMSALPLNKENDRLLFYVDMRILIDKALKHFYKL